MLPNLTYISGLDNIQEWMYVQYGFRIPTEDYNWNSLFYIKFETLIIEYFVLG
jgi:hypothetical protein